MKRWRWRVLAVLCCLALVAAAIGFRVFTFPWEAGRVRTATALALHEPEQELTGNELESFLAGFDACNSRQFELNGVLRRRVGHVTIGGEEYPVELQFDKFAGDVLVVHGRWKTLELSRQRR